MPPPGGGRSALLSCHRRHATHDARRAHAANSRGGRAPRVANILVELVAAPTVRAVHNAAARSMRCHDRSNIDDIAADNRSDTPGIRTRSLDHIPRTRSSALPRRMFAQKQQGQNTQEKR